MHATIRRYEGVDAARTNEIVGGVNETLVPRLRELPGFSGYYLVEADDIAGAIALAEQLPGFGESAVIQVRPVYEGG